MAEKERRHIVKTSPKVWARWGFLPQEQYWLSEISVAGRKAPYIQAMVRRRISLNANRVRYGWTKREYVHKVYAEYQRVGVRAKGKRESFVRYFRDTYYDYFLAWKEKTPIDKDWVSPKKKKRVRVKGATKAQTTRRKMIMGNIEDYNQRITKAVMRGDQKERRRLEGARDNWQRKLDNLR